MDLLINLRTFLSVARLGSFSAAARDFGTVPSVISKRIALLEHQCGTPLFLRSTRGLELTPAGRESQDTFTQLVLDIETAFDPTGRRGQLQDRLRIKCPTSIAIRYVSDAIISFQTAYPGVSVDLELIDRTVNPIEEGFDIAIGGMPLTFANVRDIALRPLPRSLVAAPSYFDNRPALRHPNELAGHDCLVFQTSGHVWTFEKDDARVSVDVNSKLSTTDSTILVASAIAGTGVAVISRDNTAGARARGELIELLPEWTSPPLHVKALVPERSMKSQAVTAFLDHVIATMSDDEVSGIPR